MPYRVKNPSRACLLQRRKAMRFLAMGLTTAGTNRKRRPNAANKQERLEMRRLRGIQAWNNRVAQLRKAGLTTRGNERIYAVRRSDGIILKSQLETLARSFSKLFPLVDSYAQAQMLEIEKTMSHLIKQMA